tara:strand:+ start:15725 stop:16747 length:1023 start_codon:yes stop_codon:yes gene_type:complete
MTATSSRIYIEGKRVDYTNGTLTKQGGNTASKITFTLPGKSIQLRKYWGKEVTFYFNKSDSVPMFRGYIINAEISGNSSISLRAVDVLGFLTGHHRPKIILDNASNVDGLTVSGAFKKLIELAKLDKIGTDFIKDTDPIKKIKFLRGEILILDSIISELSLIYNTNTKLPRQNIIKVVDDGKKGQVLFELLKDVSISNPIHEFNYTNNIIDFQVQNRKVPTIINVKGKYNGIIFKHESAAVAFGEHTLNITNPELKSKAECQDFAQMILHANIQDKYEYNLTTFEGVYLEENDVIHITDKDTGIEGNFRIVGKTINFSPSGFNISLDINRQPPLLAQFLS